jgi:hypothetical protein
VTPDRACRYKSSRTVTSQTIEGTKNPTLDNTRPLLSPLIVPPEVEMKKALLLSERFTTISPRWFAPTEALAAM